MFKAARFAIRLLSTISVFVLVTFIACAKKEKQAEASQQEPSAQEAQTHITETPIDSGTIGQLINTSFTKSTKRDLPFNYRSNTILDEEITTTKVHNIKITPLSKNSARVDFDLSAAVWINTSNNSPRKSGPQEVKWEKRRIIVRNLNDRWEIAVRD